MKEKIIDFLLQYIGDLPEELIILIISATPIVELRGSIPLAIGLYEMGIVKTYFISVIGNIIPVVLILGLFQPISRFMNHFLWYKKIYNWVCTKVFKKSKNIEKYGVIGLILFTAVPLPTTGAWSASVAAGLFQLKYFSSLIAISIGIMLSGVIVTAISFVLF